MKQDRYHIQFQNRRTTLTLDTILSELLAIMHGVAPHTEEAHGVVRQWLQATLTEKLGANTPSGNSISQYARRYATEAIASPDLMGKLWEIQDQTDIKVSSENYTMPL